MTAMETLLEKFEHELVVSTVKLDDHILANHTLFQPKPMIECARRWCSGHDGILVINRTCRTKEYRISLMHVVGMTATNQTFQSSFACLSREQQEEYLWAIREVNRSFGGIDPEVLVVDHEKALISAMKKCGLRH